MTNAVGLVGDDLDLYKQFLQDEELSSVHLVPLAGRPTGLWPEKAKLALVAGFPAEAVGHSAFGDGVSRSGCKSAMWSEWAGQFALLCSHEDARVRSASRIGQAYAQRRREEALSRAPRIHIWETLEHFFELAFTSSLKPAFSEPSIHF